MQTHRHSPQCHTKQLHSVSHVSGRRTSMSSSAKPLPMPKSASAASLMCLPAPARSLPFFVLGLVRCSCLTAAGRGGLGRAACSAISSSVAPLVTFFVLLRLGLVLFGACLLVSGSPLMHSQKQHLQSMMCCLLPCHHLPGLQHACMLLAVEMQ